MGMLVGRMRLLTAMSSPVVRVYEAVLSPLRVRADHQPGATEVGALDGD